MVRASSRGQLIKKVLCVATVLMLLLLRCESDLLSLLLWSMGDGSLPLRPDLFIICAGQGTKLG